jgi:hypothetical protein
MPFLIGRFWRKADDCQARTSAKCTKRKAAKAAVAIVRSVAFACATPQRECRIRACDVTCLCGLGRQWQTVAGLECRRRLAPSPTSFHSTAQHRIAQPEFFGHRPYQATARSYKIDRLPLIVVRKRSSLTFPSDTSWLFEPTTGVHQFGGGSVLSTLLQIAHSNVCKSQPARTGSILASIIGALHFGQAGRSIATNGMTDDRR